MEAWIIIWAWANEGQILGLNAPHCIIRWTPNEAGRVGGGGVRLRVRSHNVRPGQEIRQGHRHHRYVL